MGAKIRQVIPKGAYPLPDGNYAKDYPPTIAPNGKALGLRFVLKPEIDAHQLARVLIEMAREQIEAEKSTDEVDHA